MCVRHMSKRPYPDFPLEIRADRMACRELARCLAESVQKSNRSGKFILGYLKLGQDSLYAVGHMLDIGHAVDALQLSLCIVVTDQR